jgi:hypothetical protein
MTEPLTVKKVYELLRQHVHQRPDIGVGKGLLDCVLEPCSPFDSKGKRSPKRWFVLSVLLTTSTFGCFVYFNSLW